MGERVRTGISGRTRILFHGEVTTPGNSEYAILLDTTRGLPDSNSTSPAKVAAIPTPGAARGQALGRQYGVLINCTGQNVTLLKYHLCGDGTWAAKAAGTTIAASAAPQSLGLWDPSADGAQDALILVLAGATGPTKVYATVTERTIP
jgi:hypothetical protein